MIHFCYLHHHWGGLFAKVKLSEAFYLIYRQDSNSTHTEKI